METIVQFFYKITNIFDQIFDGIIEFFNTIPMLFKNLGAWANSIFPSEFAGYILALIPIIIVLVLIRFVRG